MLAYSQTAGRPLRDLWGRLTAPRAAHCRMKRDAFEFLGKWLQLLLLQRKTRLNRARRHAAGRTESDGSVGTRSGADWIWVSERNPPGSARRVHLLQPRLLPDPVSRALGQCA